MSHRRDIGWCFVIFIIGLVLRFLWIAASRSFSRGDFLYEHLAVNLLGGHGFTAMTQPPFTPTAVRPPLYSLWIALIYAIFGQNVKWVFYSQALIGSLTIPIVYLIGKQIHSRGVGLLGAFLFAIHPYPQLYVSVFFVEVLYCFLLSCAILFLSLAWKQPKQFKQWCLAGVFIGLACLTRSELFVFPLFLILLVWLFQRVNKLAILKGMVIFCISVGLTLLPWTVRNFIHFKKLIPLSNSFYGVIFLVTTLDKDEYDQKQHPSAFPVQPPTYAAHYPMAVKIFEIFGNPNGFNDVNEIALYDEQAFAAGVANVKKAPIKYFIRRIKELPYLWIESGNYLLGFIDPRIPKTTWAALIGTPDFKIIFWKFLGLLLTSLIPYFFALLGIWRYRYRLEDLIPLLSLPIFVTLIHIPFWIEARYAVPTYPFVLLLTAIGWGQIWTRDKKMEV